MIGGFHKLLESQGIPLQAFLQHCVDTGSVPDWIGYAEDALAMRWNLSTVLSRIAEAVSDVYGRDHAPQVEARLRDWVARCPSGGGEAADDFCVDKEFRGCDSPLLE